MFLLLVAHEQDNKSVDIWKKIPKYNARIIVLLSKLK